MNRNVLQSCIITLFPTDMQQQASEYQKQYVQSMGCGLASEPRRQQSRTRVFYWLASECHIIADVCSERMKIFALPALQKTFVDFFFEFAWEFCIEKWRGFLVNFFWSPFPTK